MIHHVSLGINDAARAVRFYDPVLAVIGMSRQSMERGSVGYGSAAHEYLFALEKPVDGKRATVGNGVNIAFAAAHLNVRLGRWKAGVLGNHSWPGIIAPARPLSCKAYGRVRTALWYRSLKGPA